MVGRDARAQPAPPVRAALDAANRRRAVLRLMLGIWQPT